MSDFYKVFLSIIITALLSAIVAACSLNSTCDAACEKQQAQQIRQIQEHDPTQNPACFAGCGS